MHLDTNHDGWVSYSEYMGINDRGSKLLPQERREQLAEFVKVTWESFMDPKAEGEGIEKKVHIDKIYKTNRTTPEMKEAIRRVLEILFSAVDKNADGYISLQEFQDFFVIFGIDPSFAPESFKKLDSNQDGLISHEEFMLGGMQFFTTDDDNPGKFFFGRLLDE